MCLTCSIEYDRLVKLSAHAFNFSINPIRDKTDDADQHSEYRCSCVHGTGLCIESVCRPMHHRHVEGARSKYVGVKSRPKVGNEGPLLAEQGEPGCHSCGPAAGCQLLMQAAGSQETQGGFQVVACVQGSPDGLWCIHQKPAMATILWDNAHGEKPLNSRPLEGCEGPGSKFSAGMCLTA